MNWPRDVDGDVFRRMQAHGFDFGKPHTIDFNVDFSTWPPREDALGALQAVQPDASVVPPDVDPDTGERFGGYMRFHVRALVTYELVMRVQREVTSLMAPFGGSCDSWGVLHED